MKLPKAAFLFLTLTPLPACADSGTPTIREQIASNQLLISVGIGVVLVVMLALFALVRKMYGIAAEHGMRGFKCWQFVILACCAIPAWCVVIFMMARQDPADAMIQTMAVFMVPPMILAAAGNIRQSNISFGIGWTFLQAFQAMMIGMVLGFLIIRPWGKNKS